MMSCGTGSMGFGMGFFGMGAMLGFWALVVWAGVRLSRSWTHGGRAESTLARRFAEGEIGEDEYHARLSVLRDERSDSGLGLRL